MNVKKTKSSRKIVLKITMSMTDGPVVMGPSVQHPSLYIATGVSRIHTSTEGEMANW